MRWNRLLAAFLDSAVLGAVGFLIGNSAPDYFSSIGDWGRLIGLGIAVAYYAGMIGPLGSRQTLGHRWRNLRVVTNEGLPPGGRSALVRALVLEAPFLLNGFFVSMHASWFAQLVGGALIATVAAGGVNLYLMLFNRRDGRGLHDLLSRTTIVDASGSVPPVVRRIWVGHWLIVGAITCILVVGLRGISAGFQAKSGVASRISAQLQALPNIAGQSVVDGRSVFIGPQGRISQSFCSIVVRCKRKSDDEQSMANAVASRALAADPSLRSRDILSVTVEYGYTLGIWSWRTGHRYAHPPWQWPE